MRGPTRREPSRWKRLGWVGRSVPSSIEITSIGIASRAKFGIAGTDGGSFYAYRPNPGFVGKDEFVVTLVGASSATPSFTAPAATTTLTFSLVVNDGTVNSVADTVDVVVTNHDDQLRLPLAAHARSALL